MLSGHGLVSSRVRCSELSTSAYRTRAPAIVLNFGVIEMSVDALIGLRLRGSVVPSLDRLHAVLERVAKLALADTPEDDAEELPLGVLALAHADELDLGLTVRKPREVISVARGSAPGVGVGGREDDMV